MPAPVVAIATFVGFAVVVLAVAVLNGGAAVDFRGLFASGDPRDWPRGVQEGDVPRFALRHLDALRSARPADRSSSQALADERSPSPRMEPVASDVHRYAMKRL